MLPMNITPPTRPYGANARLAIPVPRGPYRLGAHAPGRALAGGLHRAPRRPDRLRLLTDIDHRRPCRRLGSESDNGDQNPCSMRWSGCCTHTFAPCQHLCVRSQSHSECSPGRSGLTHVIRHQEPFYAFRRRPGKARGQRARTRGGKASAPRGRQGIGSWRKARHRLLEEGKASAPRGRQGIGS